jgi:hypothetical protein
MQILGARIGGAFAGPFDPPSLRIGVDRRPIRELPVRFTTSRAKNLTIKEPTVHFRQRILNGVLTSVGDTRNQEQGLCGCGIGDLEQSLC